MSLPRISKRQNPPSPSLEHLGRDARDSAALVLVTIAVVLTVSFVGIALS